MIEQKKSYHFNSKIEFKGYGKGQAIFRAVTDHLSLPNLLDSYKSMTDTHGEPSGNLNLATVSSRSFGYNSSSGASLLMHQLQELDELKGFLTIFEDQQAFSSLLTKDQKYLEKVKHLPPLWNYVTTVLNQKLRQSTNQEFRSLFHDKTNLFVDILEERRNNTRNPDEKDQKAKLFAFIRANRKTLEADSLGPKIRAQDYFIITLSDFREENEQSEVIAQSQRIYRISVSYNRLIGNEILAKNQLKYKQMSESQSVKLLTIKTKLTDHSNFLGKQLKIKNQKPFIDKYQAFEPFRKNNQIVIPFRSPIRNLSKRVIKEHYSLAFQGGGAKGLAYVGAYRALKQIKTKHNGGTTIPVKSIMGSSAGGIIALAVSTGIPDYQVQKICYKMNEIPARDRIAPLSEQQKEEHPELVPRDLYGKEIHIAQIRKTLALLFEQYGILPSPAFNSILKFLDKPEFEEIEEKIIKFIELANPTMGTIFRLNLDHQKKEKGIFKRFFTNVIYPQTQAEVPSRTRINWSGLLLHGALMKGQSICDIAAECLMKFILKQCYKAPDQEKIVTKLRQCLSPKSSDVLRERQQYEADPQAICKYLKDHIQNSCRIVDLTIGQIKSFSNQFRHLRDIIITIINRFLVLIHTSRDKHEFDLSRINLKPLMELFEVTTNNNNLSLIEYFIKEDPPTMFQKLESVGDLLESNSLKKDYDYLNSIFNRVNLIKPEFFKKQGDISKYQSTKLSDFLADIFQEYYEEVSLRKIIETKSSQGEQSELSIKRYFLALEGAEAISDTLQLIYEKQLTENKTQVPKPQEVVDYQDNFQKFKKQMAKIDLRQYYTMNGIQLTCTSVDLNDKVLRFFNHKTTPHLPVCRAVQMTGSFPVGFKAQRWKPEWGKYRVSFFEKTIEIDLNQHQFTDGGLLANFPIKYLDNDDIKYKYFSHGFVQGKTLLYGFGLDYMDESRYTLNQSQASLKANQNHQIQLALVDLKKSIFELKLSLANIGASILFSGKGQDVEWGMIWHKIIEQIPLLRFIVKLLDAYPNADRNLNLQVFENRLMVETITRPWTPQASQINQKQLLERREIIQFVKFYSEYINRAKSALKANAEKLESPPQNKIQWMNLRLIGEISQVVQQKKAENTKKSHIITTSFQKALQTNLYDYGQGLLQDKLSEKQMSKTLISILFTHLRSSDKKVKENLTKRYAYCKYIALRDGEQSYDLSQFTEKLNRINLRGLFERKNYKQISNHLSFQLFKNNFYKNIIIQQSQKISQLRGTLEKSKIVRWTVPSQQRERYLRSIAYQKRGKEDQFSYIDLMQFPVMKEKDFSNLDLYSITKQQKRLTQLIFLETNLKRIIQAKDITDKKAEVEKMIDMIKKVSYEQLLKNGDKEELINSTVIKKLTYYEIVTFIKQIIKEDKLELQPFFKRFIEDYNTEQEQQLDRLRLIHKQYLEYYLDVLQGCSNSEQLASIEVKDMRANLLKDNFFQLAKNQLLTNKNYYFQRLKKEKGISFPKQIDVNTFFGLVFDQRPVGYFIATETAEESYNKGYKGLVTYPIALEEEQRLAQKRQRVRQALIQVLFENKKNRRDYSAYNELFKRIDEFKDKIYLDRSQLVKETDILSSKTIENIQRDKFTMAEQNILQLMKFYSVSKLIKHQISKKEQKESSKLKSQYQTLSNDMKILLSLVKETMMIIRSCNIQSQCQQLISAQKEAITLYNELFVNFLANLESLSQRHVNEINELEINMSFIIKFSNMKMLVHGLYLKFEGLYLQSQRGELSNAYNKEKIKLIFGNLRKISQHNFSLPMFQSDFRLLIRSQEQSFTQRFMELFRRQSNPQLKQRLRGERVVKLQKIYDQLIKDTEQKASSLTNCLKQNKDNYEVVQRILTKLIDSSGKDASREDIDNFKLSRQDIQKYENLNLIKTVQQIQSYRPYDDKNFFTHLVLEGVDHSNEYIIPIYSGIKDSIMKLQKNKPNLENIKAITCSNYHSIFGFLLVLGKDDESIRKDMYSIRFETSTMYDQAIRNKYFESKDFIYEAPHKFSSILKYIQTQNKGLFQRLENISKKDLGQNSLKKDFSELRLIYQHERENIMDIYEEILHKTSQQIKYIDGKFLSSEKPREICKKFAFDYVCSLDKSRHEYKKLSQVGFQNFKILITYAYDSFGSLLEAIVSNSLSTSSPIVPNKDNVSQIVRGIFIMRLFTTYRLKNFIVTELKNANLSPSITLAEFYSITKRKIFLNFAAININQQRLDFLNKVTTPSMPVWAAIIASSSLPFFHKYFQANKEWEAVSSESFPDHLLDEFFKEKYNPDQNITHYASANYISSLPLELLTNSTVADRMYRGQNFGHLKYCAFAFNRSYSNSIPDFKISKNFFKEKLFGTIWGAIKLKSKRFTKSIPSAIAGMVSAGSICKLPEHKNNTYIKNFGTMSFFAPYYDSGSFSNTMNTLSSSNDNFIMKWYYNRLIRLPIKINTLSFHQIVDPEIMRTFNISLPSYKAKETIERSYQITKSFINELGDPKEKYKAKLRVQITTIYHQVTGFERNYLKLQILNHSKWNQNKYNNFVVMYAPLIPNQSPTFTRANQSEIIWLVEDSSKLHLKFFYPRYDPDNNKNNKIEFTEMILNFEGLVKRLPLRDSFDYEVTFGTDKEPKDENGNGKDEKKLIRNLRAYKRNGILISEKQTELGPNAKGIMSIPAVNQQILNSEASEFKKYYIKRSNYTGDQ